MRQWGDYCGKTNAGPFWHRLADFLFQTNRFSRNLIAYSQGALSAIVRGWVIDALLLRGNV